MTLDASGLEGMFGLRSTTAIVTGASSGGLGQHIAFGLATAGARVAVLDRQETEANLAVTLDALPHDGGHLADTCDVTEEAAVEAAVTRCAERLGGVDILVHAAGVMLRKDALETTVDEWRRIVDINLTGTWLTNRAAARHMIPRGRGRIVNISTLYTNIVGPLPESAYYASKAGVAQVTRALAAEWGPHGVNVNCVAPGVFFPTRMTEPLREQPDVLERMKTRTLLHRLGDPATDLPGVITFLVSPAARYVTGQVLFVDGGWTAW